MQSHDSSSSGCRRQPGLGPICLKLERQVRDEAVHADTNMESDWHDELIRELRQQNSDINVRSLIKQRMS